MKVYAYIAIRIILVAFVIVLVLLGAMLYDSVHRSHDGLAASFLKNTTELKARQIELWLNERRADALAISGNPIIRKKIVSYLQNSNEDADRAELFGWMDNLGKAYDYSAVSILYEDEQELISWESQQKTGARALIAEQFRKLDKTAVDESLAMLPRGQGRASDELIVFFPFHFGRGSKPVYLALMGDVGHLFQGILNDESYFLASAESYLVMRNGAEAAVFTGLKKSTASPAFRRSSIAADPPTLAAIITSGQLGLVDATDYHGDHVLAFVHEIPDTSWYLVSKVDHAEIESAIQVELLKHSAIFFSLCLTIVFVIVRSNRVKNLKLLRHKLDAETKLRQQNQRLADLMSESSDAILILDPDWRITECNDKASNLYGYPREDLLAEKLNLLEADNARESLVSTRGVSPEHPYFHYEAEHVSMARETLYVELSGRLLRYDDRQEIIITVRDISERKKAEQHIARLNRLYASSSGVNQLVARATDMAALFQGGCHLLVAKGGFKMAWVGLDQGVNRPMKIDAVAGDDHGYTQELIVTGDESATGLGPAGTAFRNGIPVVINDILQDASMRPWHERARSAGVNSVMCLPLKVDGKVQGVLSVYSESRDYFVAEERALVIETGEDIAYAMGNIMSREAAKLARMESMERENILGLIFANAMDAIGLVEVTSRRFVEFNRAAYEGLGYSLDEFARLNFDDITGNSPETNAARVAMICANPKGIVFEARHRHKDGSWRDVRVSAHMFSRRGQDYLVAIWTDITEQIRSQKELAAQAARMQLFFRHAPGAVAVLDTQMRYVMASQRWLADYHLELENVLCRSHYEIFPDIPERWREIHRRCLAGIAEACEADSFVRPDGKVEWLRWEVRPWLDQDGRIGGIMICSEIITERRNAELALRRSEERFRGFLENSPIPMAVCDKQGKIGFLNRQFTELFGCSQADLPHLDAWWPLAYPDPQYREKVQAQWGEALAEAKAQGSLMPAVEANICCKDGTIRTVLVMAAELQHELLVSFVDVTLLRKSEQDLRREQQFTEAMMENVGVGVVACDATGKIKLFNKTARFWHDLDCVDADSPHLVAACELYEADGQTRVHMESMPLMRAMHGESLRNARMVLKSKSQPPRPVLIDATPVITYENAKVGAVVVIHDISGEVASQAQMRLQSEALNAAANSISIIDERGIIIWANKAFATMTGYSPEEIIGQKHKELMSSEQPDDLYKQVWENVSAGNVWHGERKSRRKDGRLFEEEVTITPLKDPAGQITHYIAIKQDITERRKLEHQYLRSQRMESVGLLAGGIAHDLNNVLAPILMSAELLESMELPPQVLRAIDTIESSARRGADIVQQVLTFARGIEGQKGPVQLRHLVKEMAKMANETFPKNIRIRNYLPSQLWVIEGDTTQLHQVLLNLSVNARDAMPDGGELAYVGSNITVEAGDAFDCKGVAPGHYACLEVRDSGTGIPVEIIDKIFEPFFTTKETGKGTGLGLSAVIGIIKGHGGYIEVTNRSEGGAQFQILLPALRDSRVVGAAKIAEKLTAGRGELILLVDDEANIRNIARSLLEKQGYRVLVASNGEEAINLVSEKCDEIAAVITDIMMPKLDGVKFIKQAQRLNPDIKYIAVSGLMGVNGQYDLTDLKALGVSQFLTKPFSVEKLFKALDEELHQNKPRES